MAEKKVLLDTNAYTALLAGSKAVLDSLSLADQVFMSTIDLGELEAGFRGGTRDHENREQLEELLRRPPVRTLDVTRGTAEVFGRLKQDLRKAGTPIPINDVWIAAHAIESGSWLLTFDRHFLQVKGLLLWSRTGAQ